MKTIYFSIIFSFLLVPLTAQELTPKDFVGSWKVTSAKVNPAMIKGISPEAKKLMIEVLKGFNGAVITFRPTGEAKIVLPKNAPPFLQEFAFNRNEKWIIEDKKMIAIGTKKDKYSLMGILVKTKDGKKIFMLNETPFMLEVVKIK